MNKEFIPYEQALSLKELGFNEPCFGYWNKDPQLKNPTFNMVKPFEHEWCLPAPTFSQAFRWFREKYGLRIRNYVFVNYSGNISEGFEIFKYSKDTIDRVEALTYEEAELACLKKLIELVKERAI